MDHARKILPKMVDIIDPRQVQKGKDFPPDKQQLNNSNTFPGKLWKLVNDDFYRSINWSEDGMSINIDALKFKHEVLKCVDSMFKTKNFSSFVRQLNLYGFKKITSLHPNSHAYEFPNSSFSHTHHQWHSSSSSNSSSTNNGDLQHFQHNSFKRHHPELLIHVRRASAAQKRKAETEQNRYPDFQSFPAKTIGSSILRDRTNFNDPYHKHKNCQAPSPLSLRCNKGKIFGLSLIASASPGSLVGTPTTDQFDYNKLCDQNGQLKKFVVIGRQDAFDDDPMLSDSTLLSPRMPILKAYNMSPLGNPKSSVGYALTESSLDASIAEAEDAVSFLMNGSFESSPSPQPLSPWHEDASKSQDEEPDSSNKLLTSSSSSSLQSSGYNTTNSSSSNPSRSSLSAPTSSSISGRSAFMTDSSDSSVPSLYHTSSSSFTSGQSFSHSSDGMPIMNSFDSSGMIPPSSFSSKVMPPLGTIPGKDIFTPSSLASLQNGGILVQTHPGKDMTSSFITSSAIPDYLPLSQPLIQFEQQMMTEQSILVDCEEQLATPLGQSPADFPGGLFSGHPVSSTPILSGPPGCSTPNCPCQHGKGHPMFCPPPPPPTPFQLYNVQPMTLDPY